MIPGPNEILRIPTSGDLVKIATLTSGNTFGADWWSDGKMDAPMLPDRPWLRRHPDTGETFWTDECEEIGSEEPWSESGESGDVPFAETATENDLRDRLRDQSLTPEKEQYLRTRLWWIWNDAQRQDGSSAADDTSKYDTNLRKLRSLLDVDDPDSRLMAAEVSRELGDHDRALELLEFDYSEDYEAAVRTIRLANAQGERHVIKIT